MLSFLSNLFGVKATQYIGVAQSSNLELSLHTNSPIYAAGDCVYGTLYIWARQPVQVNTVSIKISAKEEVEYKYSRTVQVNGHSRTETRYARSFREVFGIEVPILGAGMFPAGYWAYNWQIRIPDTAPGISHYMNGAEFARILYSMTARVVTYSDVAMCKQPLVIHAKPRRPPHSPFMEKTHVVRTCCCVGRGTVFATLWFERAVYTGEETVRGRLFVRNDSEVDVEYLSFGLVRRVVLRVAGAPSETRTTTLALTKYAGVAKNSSREQELALPLFQSGGFMSPGTTSHSVLCTYSLLATVAVPWAPDLEFGYDVDIVPSSNPYWTDYRVPQWATNASLQMTPGGHGLQPERAAEVFGPQCRAVGWTPYNQGVHPTIAAYTQHIAPPPVFDRGAQMANGHGYPGGGGGPPPPVQMGAMQHDYAAPGGPVGAASVGTPQPHFGAPPHGAPGAYGAPPHPGAYGASPHGTPPHADASPPGAHGAPPPSAMSPPGAYGAPPQAAPPFATPPLAAPPAAPPSGGATYAPPPSVQMGMPLGVVALPPTKELVDDI